MPAKSQVYIVNEDAASKDAIITDDTPKTPWKSIYFIGVLALCTAIQFSLYFSSMWPYLQLLDHTVTEEFYGYVVAVYSAGLIIAAPLIGFWSNRVKNIRTPVRFCICLQLSGNLLYFFAQLLPFGRKFAVMFARFFVGAACCHSGLLKAYAATASVAADRSRAMAIFTGGVAFGLTVGPGLQLIFVPLGFPGFKLFDLLQINMYTTPPLAAMFLNSTALFIMTFLFEETYAGLVTSSSHAVKDKEGEKEEKEHRRAKDFKIPPFDKLALVLCHLGRFTQTFTFTALETIGTAYAMTIFAWTKKEAVTYVAISYSFMSVVEFLAYALFVFAKLDRWLKLRFHCLCGFAALIILHLITFSWPFLPGELTTYTNKDMERHLNQSAPEPVGCNLDRLSWCAYTKPVNVWVYNISFVLIVGVSYCVINITLETLFSKVLGPRRQAAHQGFLEMTEGAARFSGPVLIRYKKNNNFSPKWPPKKSFLLLHCAILVARFVFLCALLNFPILSLQRQKLHRAQELLSQVGSPLISHGVLSRVCFSLTPHFCAPSFIVFSLSDFCDNRLHSAKKFFVAKDLATTFFLWQKSALRSLSLLHSLSLRDVVFAQCG